MVSRRAPEDLEDAFLDGDPYLTPAEVADLFRVQPKTVTRWAAEGKLAGVKLAPAKRWRFRESVVRKQLAKGAPDGDQD